MINIPPHFKEILERDPVLDSMVTDLITLYYPIFEDNKLFFFEEYTDHGVKHIQNVLKAAEFIIPEVSFQYIKPQEVAVLILAILLHDIGMHIEYSTFNALLNGEYEDVRVDILDQKSWKDLWNDYLLEIKHLSSVQKENIWGDPLIEIKEPNLSNKDYLTGVDKKLIGEFIRRHHARLSHEIAYKGIIGKTGTISFTNRNLSELYVQLIGIVARSHGMNIRDTFPYLQDIAYGSWKNTEDINVIYLMVLLRISDYLQIDISRTEPNLLKLKTFNSPISTREHTSHLAIKSLTFRNEDPELILVTCEPNDPSMYVKLKDLIYDIQSELDLSWAILGEIYGFYPKEKPQLKFRRINSNLGHPLFLKKLEYVPQKISFQINNDLSRLLVAPLYGDDPKFGIRELVQNSTDACKERFKMEQDKGSFEYKPSVIVSVDIIKNSHIFKIKDNGKGMSLDEILHYFLKVGASFRKSYNWKKEFISENGDILIKRNGKFGIGVLASFLLGNEIFVKTKCDKEPYIYEFNAKIDSEYITINKIKNTSPEFIGTEISILMDSDRVDKLINQKVKRERYYFDRLISWNDWYVGNDIDVQYFINGKECEKTSFLYSFMQREITLPNFGKIKWTYPPLDNYFKDYRYSGLYIICNEILVTDYSEFRRFHYLEQEGTFTEGGSIIENFIIDNKPSLIIEDRAGLLPLKLDRSDVDSTILPFEDELLLDVSKDFLARLLTLPISNDKICDQCQHPYYVPLLYTSQGFSPASDFFLEKLNEDHFNLYRILTKNKSQLKGASIFFKISPNSAIYPKFDNYIGLSNQTENVAPKIGARIILTREKYEELFNSEIKSRLEAWAKKEHTVEWSDDKYIIYTIRYQKDTVILNEDFGPLLMNNMDTNIESIQEIPFEYFKRERGGEVLNKLFNKYLGKNYIIPYNMAERRKLYSKAFEDLETYMNDYINLDNLDIDE